jgi:hypothetical protein
MQQAALSSSIKIHIFKNLQIHTEFKFDFKQENRKTKQKFKREKRGKTYQAYLFVAAQHHTSRSRPTQPRHSPAQSHIPIRLLQYSCERKNDVVVVSELDSAEAPVDAVSDEDKDAAGRCRHTQSST